MGQPPIFEKHSAHKTCRVAGRLEVIVAPQNPSGVGERAQHQAVPRAEDFIVQTGPDAGCSSLEQNLACVLEPPGNVVFRERKPLRQRRYRLCHKQNVMTLEVSGRRDAVMSFDQFGVVTEQV